MKRFGTTIIAAIVTTTLLILAYSFLPPPKTQAFVPASNLGQKSVPVTIHVATPDNITDNSTQLSIAPDNKNAVLQVTANWNARGDAQVPYNTSPLGVWFNGQYWLIFNQNRAPMPAGAGFNVYQDAAGFVHQATAANISGNSTYLDHPALNGNISAALLVTPLWNPPGTRGVYNPHHIGVWYDAGRQRWAVFNQNLTDIPLGAAFNISFGTVADSTGALVTLYTGSGVRVHTANTGNTTGHSTYLNIAARRPKAVLLVTQLWNPGGRKGVYNPHPVGVWYDESRQQWAIFNIDRAAIPSSASFFVQDVTGDTPIVTIPVPLPPSVGTQVGTATAGQINAGIPLPTSIPNPSFEQGYEEWLVEGTAFGTAPNEGAGIPAYRAMRRMRLESDGIGGDYWHDINVPIGVKGNFWASSGERAEAGNHLPNVAARGTLTSSDFQLKKRYVSFLISGLSGRGDFRPETWPRVELQRWQTGSTYSRVSLSLPDLSGVPLNRLLRVTVDVTEGGVTPAELAAGKVRARIVVSDDSDTGYINVDDFQLLDAPPQVIPGLSLDLDHPVWGFADTHAHPTHQHGFGGKTIRGDTDGPMATAFATEKCTSAHSGVIRVMGGRNHQHAAIGAIDGHIADGFPTFIGWPRFTSKTHQQHHVEWFKRAHDGGLRLIVALGVTNMFWATRALGPGIEPGKPVDDESAVLLQIEEMKRIARENPLLMEVALTPADARRIILSNKIAVVLGVEMDNFGNFKDASYPWRDNYPMPPSRPLTPLPVGDAEAQAAIQTKLREYHDLGIRQVTPLHYVSTLFGGTAAFRWQFAMINGVVTGQPYRLRDGADEGAAFHIADDFALHQALLGSLGEFATNPLSVTGLCASPCPVSTMSAEGLTPRGSRLMKELMRQGFLLDAEHLSIPSARDLGRIAGLFDYPLLSSHTDPADLSFVPRTRGLRFGGSLEEKLANFGTTLHNNLRHEGQLSAEGFDRIRTSGGTVGVLAFPFRKLTYRGSAGAVSNDCDGSSKSWAQMYLYSVERMGGRGVALSTDRGFNDFIAPRFGVHAAFSLRPEELSTLKDDARRIQRYAQTNGVRYDQPLRDWHPSRFEFGQIPGNEEDVWKALAYWNATRINPNDKPRYDALPADQKVPASSDAAHSARILNLVKGLAQTDENRLERPAVFTGDAPWEQAAMHCLVRGIQPEQLRIYSGDDIRNVRRIYNMAEPIYRLWQNMSGNNVPLRRRQDGRRDWDINIDGIAHYGMLPDFLQDLKNVGLTGAQLQPLFNSAEDYIRMWEKAERAKASVRD